MQVELEVSLGHLLLHVVLRANSRCETLGLGVAHSSLQTRRIAAGYATGHICQKQLFPSLCHGRECAGANIRPIEECRASCKVLSFVSSAQIKCVVKLDSSSGFNLSTCYKDPEEGEGVHCLEELLSFYRSCCVCPSVLFSTLPSAIWCDI